MTSFVRDKWLDFISLEAAELAKRKHYYSVQNTIKEFIGHRVMGPDTIKTKFVDSVDSAFI